MPSTPATPDPVVLNAPAGGSAEPTAGDVDRELIERVTGWRSKLKELVVGYGIAAFLFVVAVLVAGWEWALPATGVACVCVYFYTKKVHVEPGVRILVVGKDEASGSIMVGAYVFPPIIFQTIVTSGLSNSVFYHGQLAYLAESIDWDEDAWPDRLPLRVNFAWIHFNSLNYLLDYDLFHELKEAFILSLEKAERLERYMEPLIQIGISKGLEERFDLLAHAARSPDLWSRDKGDLRAQVAETTRRLRQLSVDSDGRTPEDVKATAAGAATSGGT